MSNALAGLFGALGQAGGQFVDYKAKEKERLLQAALERERQALQRNAQEINSREHGETLALQREGMNRDDQRAIDAREFSQAQWMGTNMSGAEDIGEKSAALMDKWLPGMTTRKTKVDAPVAGAPDINGLPNGGTFRESVDLRDTNPASVRNALTKAETDTKKLQVAEAKNALTAAYQQRRLEIDSMRTAIMQQGVGIDAGRLKVAQDNLALMEQKAWDDFELGSKRIEASIYGIDVRGTEPENPMEALMQRMLMGQLGGAAGAGFTPPPSGPPRPAPVRPTPPVRPSGPGGGTAPGGTPSIKDMIDALAGYAQGRQGGGGR